MIDSHGCIDVLDVMKTRSNKLAIVRFLKIPQEDLLGYEYGLRKGAVFQPSYFVSVDRGHEAVVLGIRGTWVREPRLLVHFCTILSLTFTVLILLTESL